jgi:hypothetical protein
MTTVKPGGGFDMCASAACPVARFFAERVEFIGVWSWRS